MRAGLSLSLILFLTISCIDQKDYKLTTISVQPTMAIPIAFGNMTILDVLKKSDSAYIKINSADDGVYLDYRQMLLTTDIRDLIKIPDLSLFQSLIIPSAPIAKAKDVRKDSLTEVIDLGLDPAKLTEIDFKAGTISYSATLLPTLPDVPYELEFSSVDFTSKATGKPLLITAPPSGTLSLSDYTVKLTNNKFNLKLVLILKKNNNPGSSGPNRSVAVQFLMTGMDFNLVKGFLGDQIAHPKADTLKIDAFGKSLDSAHVSFSQPTITMDVIDDYGVPCKLNFLTFLARKSGATLPGQISPANPVSIAYPSVPGNSATTVITATNAKQMMDFGPTQIIYQFDAHLNQGLNSGNNFMADTSKLRVRLNVLLPLSGRGSNIILRDTTSIDLGNLSESEVKSATLKMDVNNQMPLDAKLQFYLADQNHAVIDSLLDASQTSLIKGSTVTGAGDLSEPGVLSEMIPLNADKLNKIFTAKYVIIKAALNTSTDSAGNPLDVNFKSKYAIVINMGMLAELDFSIKKN